MAGWGLQEDCPKVCSSSPVSVLDAGIHSGCSSVGIVVQWFSTAISTGHICAYSLLNFSTLKVHSLNFASPFCSYMWCVIYLQNCFLKFLIDLRGKKNLACIHGTHCPWTFHAWFVYVFIICSHEHATSSSFLVCKLCPCVDHVAVAAVWKECSSLSHWSPRTLLHLHSHMETYLMLPHLSVLPA